MPEPRAVSGADRAIEPSRAMMPITANGSQSASFMIAGLMGGGAVNLRCLISNACGEATRNFVLFGVGAADFNCAGAICVQDIFDDLAAHFSGGA